MDAMLNWLLQGSVVAIAWFAMLRVLDRARANVRYTVCWAAMLLIVALPALTSLRSVPSSDASLLPRGAAIVALPDSWWTSALVMLGAWAVWAGLCTVRFVSAMLALRRARARSRAFPSQLEADLPHWNHVRVAGRCATLVLSDSVSTAAVLPWGAPMIAVSPSLVRTLDPVELDRVLIHEWAHVQRRDDVVHILQLAVRMIAGWHPAVWWIDRRLHTEREIACDEMTVAITGSPKSYAACLMKLAGLRATARAMQAAPAVVTVSGLSARVKKLVTPHRSIAPVWSRSLAAAIVSTLCAMSVGLGGLELVETAAFALPAVPPRIVTTTLQRLAPAPLPTRMSRVDQRPSSRRTVQWSLWSQRETAAQEPARRPSPPQDPKSDAPAATGPVNPTNSSAPSPEVDVKAPAPSDPSTVVHNPEPVTAAAKTEEPRSPWGAAADSGVALGRTSKKAGVATAGFFTRFARSVAGSF